MSETLDKTAIFWDYENVPFSSGDLTNFLNDIEELKKNLGDGSFLRCFGDWKQIPETTQTEIRQAGFELLQVPQTRKNAVDQAITISAINVYHQSHYNEFFLISADGDFTALLMDLKNKGVRISIIARKKVISKDLIQYCSEQFYLTSNGYVFKFVPKERDDILDTIERSMEDAKKALENLVQRQNEKGVQIFHFEEWKDSFLSLENYNIQPLILGQLITLEEFFKIYVKSYGYGHTANFKYLCIHPSEKLTPIKELEIDKQIPNSKKIRLPIRTIPKTGYKDLIPEFGIDENFKIQGEDKEGTTNNNIGKKIVSLISNIDEKIYLSEIAKGFRNMVKNEKSPGEIKLNNLNTIVCESLGVPPSKKIYKQLGFKTFSKAVEAAKAGFSRKIKINKDAITF